MFQLCTEQPGEQEDGICLVDLLKSNNVELLNFWLSRFVVEARREDGNPYPPVTIHNLMSGLYRHSKSKVSSGIAPPNFMNCRDLQGALQVYCRQLRIDGIGAFVKHTTIVTLEEENMLWETKVIGDHRPLALL